MNITFIIKKYDVKITGWKHRRYLESDAHFDYLKLCSLEMVDLVLGEFFLSTRLEHKMRDCLK